MRTLSAIVGMLAAWIAATVIGLAIVAVPIILGAWEGLR
jgi:hypothetical protein